MQELKKICDEDINQASQQMMNPIHRGGNGIIIETSSDNSSSDLVRSAISEELDIDEDDDDEDDDSGLNQFDCNLLEAS